MFIRRIKSTIVLAVLLLLSTIVYRLGATPPEPIEEKNILTGEIPIIVGGMAEVRSISDTAARQDLLVASTMNEGFEGTWPTNEWQLFDDSSSDGGEYLFGRRNCQPHTGSFSGWSIGGGLQGSALDCLVDYPNNAQSWAIYGPFDLSDATSASLNFYVWGATPGVIGCPLDYLFAGSSNDGASFSGVRYCGDWSDGNEGNGYYVSSLDLSNKLGQAQVWVGFLFSSNNSGTNIGFTIDDLVLDINTSSSPTPTSTSMPIPPPATEEFQSYVPIAMNNYERPTETPTPVPSACPQGGSWNGTTSQGRDISYTVSGVPDCKVIPLTINYQLVCVFGFVIITETFTSISPPPLIINNHFEIGNGISNVEVIGDFSSDTFASGTWNRGFTHNQLGYCSGSGTWSANFNS